MMANDLQGYRPRWRVLLGLLAARFRRNSAWRRRLRVTLTFDLDVPDDRMLVTKVDSVLRMIGDRQGVDNTPPFSIAVVDGTNVAIHHHYENLYYENGKFVERVEGGTRAPQFKP